VHHNVGWEEGKVESLSLSLTHHIFELQIVDCVGCHKQIDGVTLRGMLGGLTGACVYDSVLFVKLQ
jgi:hypothetical protein